MAASGEEARQGRGQAMAAQSLAAARSRAPIRGSDPVGNDPPARRRQRDGFEPVAGRYIERRVVYLDGRDVYTRRMTKRLIDVDDDALDAARAELGTLTIKDTVNEALRRAARQRSAELANALTVLADADLDERSAAWR
jgi:Arc/MetJ family transcription regulator